MTTVRAIDNRLTRSRRIPRVLRDVRLTVGGVVVLVVFVLAAIGPWLGLTPPDQMDFAHSLQHPFVSWQHVLGTDSYGRDLLSRVVLGARYSVEVGTGAVLIALLLGTTSGLVAGFLGGLLDAVIMRVMDTLLAFPPILSAVVLVGVIGPGLWNVVLGVGVVYTPVFARIARAKTLSVRSLPYVEAAQSLGGRRSRILARHIVPNIMGPVIVQATVAYAFAIVAEAGLSFLGLGVQPPAPSWGSMLSDARPYIQSDPWFALVPGLALAISVLGITFVGDALRDWLDPKGRGR